MSAKLTTLDLFSGIGGIALGLEATGHYVTKWFCEKDAKAQQVLRRHFPTVPIHSDAATLRLSTGAFDVIAGGFPCQDISVGGKGAGLSGSRSGLWFEFERLIQEGRPKGVLIENVEMLKRRGLDTILAGLSALRYDAEWYTLPASNSGAPHRRRRIWIAAYRQCERRARLVPLERSREIGQWHWAGETHLREIYRDPFGRSDLWPEPLLRRMDVRTEKRVDRLRLIGNSALPVAATEMGRLLYSRIMAENA